MSRGIQCREVYGKWKLFVVGLLFFPHASKSEYPKVSSGMAKTHRNDWIIEHWILIKHAICGFPDVDLWLPFEGIWNRWDWVARQEQIGKNDKFFVMISLKWYNLGRLYHSSLAVLRQHAMIYVCSEQHSALGLEEFTPAEHQFSTCRDMEGSCQNWLPRNGLLADTLLLYETICVVMICGPVLMILMMSFSWLINEVNLLKEIMANCVPGFGDSFFFVGNKHSSSYLVNMVFIRSTH